MNATIEGAPAFGHLQVILQSGETLVAESNAMASMSAAIEMRAQLNGGLLGAVLRKLFGGESLFINRFTNPTRAPQKLTLVQPAPGDLRCRELAKGETYYLQPGAFVACDTSVKLGLAWAGLVSFIAREGLFKIAVTGPGRVWFGAYGALLEREVDGELIVDSSHLVAYEPGIKLHLQLAGGWVSSVLGGEGLVTRVAGRGKIVVQTRSITGLAAWLNPKF